MITLFTGMPGAGKTAALVDLMYSELGDRPLFVDGLEGLTIPHFPCDASTWHIDLPDGAVLVVDEAQRKWRPRPASAAVPLHVSEMETHRHKGIDIFLTTQNPKLIDSNVRSLVGRHVHIRDMGILGRHWYEWPECSESIAWKTCTNHHRYKLPERVFGLYKSASVHVKPIRGIPRAVFIGLFAVLFLVIVAYIVYGRMNQRFFEKPVSPVVVGAGVGSDSSLFAGANHKKPIDDRVDWIPKVSTFPESAPAYQELRTVVVMPVVHGGYCDKSGCRCFTNQGVLSALTSADCEPIVKHGRFDPYRAPSSSSFGMVKTAPKPLP
ncbi:MAG: hypothetical protein RIR79_586 [Pseudomonadota bacterium]|jgi:zona occludens toxin